MSKKCNQSFCNDCYKKHYHNSQCGCFIPTCIRTCNLHTSSSTNLHGNGKKSSSCSGSVGSVISFSNHSSSSSSSNNIKYACSDCNKIFSKQTGLEMHQREKKHGNWAIFWECDYCLQHFHSANDLHHHENTFCKTKSTDKDDLSRCNFCGEIFQKNDDLIDHYLYCFQRVRFYENLDKKEKKQIFISPSSSSASKPSILLETTKTSSSFKEKPKIKVKKQMKNYAKPEKIVKKTSLIAKKNISRCNSAPSFPKNSNSKALCCETCSLVFNHSKLLEDHQRNNYHGRFYHKCCDCSRVCRYEKSLRDHQRSKSHGAFKPSTI